MSWSLSILLLSAAPMVDVDQSEHFKNYTKAYRVAEFEKKPMLVILNPADETELEPVPFSLVKRTRYRRNLLEKYVVVVIDTSTQHGKIMHGLFQRPKLPYVSVIDKDQKIQIYNTAEKLNAQHWDNILDSFQTGDRSLKLKSEELCAT